MYAEIAIWIIAACELWAVFVQWRNKQWHRRCQILEDKLIEARKTIEILCKEELPDAVIRDATGKKVGTVSYADKESK